MLILQYFISFILTFFLLLITSFKRDLGHVAYNVPLIVTLSSLLTTMATSLNSQSNQGFHGNYH